MPRTRPVRPIDAPEVRLFDSTVRLQVTDVQATDSLSYLEGRAVPYNVPTDTGWYYIEHFVPGSLAASLRSVPNVPLLLFHNAQSFPIGAASEWNDGSDGLDGVWRLDDSLEAQRAARSAADGFLTGMSISFAPVESQWTYADWEEWDPDDPSTYDSVARVQARLLETSLTPTPAYADAAVSLVRSSEGRRHARQRPPGRPGRRIETVPTLLDTPRLDKWRNWRSTLDS